jgi:hypothetical protein
LIRSESSQQPPQQPSQQPMQPAQLAERHAEVFVQ